MKRLENEERRNETRVERHFLVNISKDNGFEVMGLTSNLSIQGMFIAIPRLLPFNGEVSILLGIADKTITMKGQVIWSRKWSNRLSDDVQAAVGVKILDTPEEYIEYVKHMVQNPTFHHFTIPPFSLRNEAMLCSQN